MTTTEPEHPPNLSDGIERPAGHPQAAKHGQAHLLGMRPAAHTRTLHLDGTVETPVWQVSLAGAS